MTKLNAYGILFGSNQRNFNPTKKCASSVFHNTLYLNFSTLRLIMKIEFKKIRKNNGKCVIRL